MTIPTPRPDESIGEYLSVRHWPPTINRHKFIAQLRDLYPKFDEQTFTLIVMGFFQMIDNVMSYLVEVNFRFKKKMEGQ